MMLSWTANPTGLTGKSDDRTPDTADPAYSPRLSAQATASDSLAVIVTIERARLSVLAYITQSSKSCFPISKIVNGDDLFTFRTTPQITIFNEVRTNSAKQVTLIPASTQRSRWENPQSDDSPVDFLPTTPVTVEVGYPMILDPVTPTVYTPGLAIPNRSNALPLSRTPPGPVRTRARKDSLNRGRDPYRQDLRGQGGVSQRTTLEPRRRSGDELAFAMGYGSGYVEGASRNGDTPNSRSRRLPQVNLDWYGTSSRVTPPM
ncbi:hypothetical protein E2P81_ATG01542 [Venturia nashicola]|nr:hypothetical protein E2P81_ATG01542 [Venturia nashicola]